MELPKSKIKASRVNPKTMVIFSQPKMGKTTALAGLDNCLIIDLEEGTNFLDSLKYDVIHQSKLDKCLPIITLKKLINAIRETNDKNKAYTYKYIAIDTVTALEEIVLPLANKMYRDTPMGRNWKGTDVTDLPNGAGYRYTRLALSQTVNDLEQICDTLLIMGHVKDKLVEQDGKEMNERGLALTGRMSSILCSKVDSVGYLYRKENKTIINFAASPNLLSGSRSEHLKDRELVVAESDESGNIAVNWSEIFI